MNTTGSDLRSFRGRHWRTPKLATALLGLAGAALAAYGQPSKSAHYAFTADTLETGGSAASGSYAAGFSFPSLVSSPAPGAAVVYTGFLTRTLAGLVTTGVFYNRSVWDGQDPAITDLDAAAIAPDKASLRPKQAASFANVSTFTRGLNGIVLDIAQLGGPVTAADFRFSVGTNNLPPTWAPAPPPTSLAIQWQAGADGTDRIFITWPDNAIRDEWLRIELLPTETSRLRESAIFYYGHTAGAIAAGADGVYPSPAAASGALTHFGPGAAITSPYDFDRDGVVGVSDVELVLESLCDNRGLPLLDLGQPVELPPLTGNPAVWCGQTWFLASTVEAGPVVRFWFATATDAAFDVEQSSDLGTGALWSTLPGNAIHSIGPRIHWVEFDPAANGSRFVRVRAR